jgi:hypothetical protein
MKRILIPALLAAAFSASAQAGSFAEALIQPLTVKPQSGGIPHNNDETDLSWLYVAPTAKQFAAAPASVVAAPVRIGDENDASWIYQPQAKPMFDTTQVIGDARPYVESGDENNLAWLYQAPTAKFVEPARRHPHVGFAAGDGTGRVARGSDVSSVAN